MLLLSPTVTHTMLETTVSFLSHCCQVVPLGRLFLHNLFSQICRNSHSHLFRFRLTPDSRNDLRWWLQFLRSWSSVSIRLSKTNRAGSVQFARTSSELENLSSIRT